MVLLLDLADAARKSGLVVIELPNWKSNESPGGFAPDGVLNHHTAAFDPTNDPNDDYAYAMHMAFTGRSDLPPPNCNLALSAECVVYVAAAGNANHAGPARASGPMPPASDGNVIYIGIEAMNSGSQGWSSLGLDAAGKQITQYEAYVRLNAALCDHYGWPATHVRGHKETSVTGKIDPTFDMDQMRTDVAAKMKEMNMPEDDGFWLWVCSVNWGRGYSPGVFKRNVQRVINQFEGKVHVVYIVQELDEEPDAANEHDVFGSMLEPGTHKVAWPTREPIVLSPGFAKVTRERVRVTMESGGKIGAPKGTGPTRHSVTCATWDEGLRLGFGNTHPHRNLPNHAVQVALRKGERVFSKELTGLYASHGGTSVIWGADPNNRNFPEMIPGEKTAIEHGNTGDTIRYKSHLKGARLELHRTGHLNGTIDPHDPIYALFRASKR